MCPQANYYMPRNINISLSAEYTDEDVEKVIFAIKKVAAAIL